MRSFINRLLSQAAVNRSVLKNCQTEIAQQNLQILKAILLVTMGIFGVDFFVATFSYHASESGYMNLQWAYAVLIILAALLYLIIKLLPQINVFVMIYTVYSIAIAYCIFTSSFISPQYVSVTILAMLFQIPILYIDKSSRINLFLVLGAVIYLVCIAPFKESALYVDEIINVFSFSAIAIVVGEFSRKSRLETFKAKAELQYFAYFDAITNLSNRRKFFEDLHTIDDSEEKRRMLSGMAMVDIDFFKKYNDTYGHQAGDYCLREIADRFIALQSLHNIHFYRYGGEEFTVLFYESSPVQISQLAETIRMEIEKAGLPHSASSLGIVTVSLGYALCGCTGGESAENYILKADKALYAAKAGGRNCMICYDEALGTDVSESKSP